MNTHVTIVCSLHGDFNQSPANHLHGHGCTHCGIQERRKKRTQPNQFIERAQKIHMDRYDYSKVIYKNSFTHVDILCKVHGIFTQAPSNHLKGHGCKRCGHLLANQAGNPKLTTDQFILRAKAVHGDLYDYSKTTYETSLKKVNVRCKTHGHFEVDPRKHFKGYGCPICTGCGVSFAQLEWLRYIQATTGNDIIYKGGTHNKEEAFRFDSKLYRVDGYCKETKTIYEFLGCWYHGCPTCRDATSVHPWSKKTMRELYEDCIKRKTIFEQNGYTVAYIWECEWTQQKKVESVCV